MRYIKVYNYNLFLFFIVPENDPVLLEQFG